MLTIKKKVKMKHTYELKHKTLRLAERETVLDQAVKE